MILRRFHYHHRHSLLLSLASRTTVKVHKIIFVHAVFIVACPQIPFNKSAETYAMLSDEDMLCSVVGGGCGASNAEEGSAIAEDEGKTSGLSRGRGKAKARGRGRKVGQAPNGGQQQPDSAQKACQGHCGKSHELTEFNTDQNICKECNNDKRRFARLVKAQEETAWWEALQRENPKAAEKTLKSYSREHKKHGPKHKFSVMQHKRRLKTASGVRGSKEMKWMW